MCVCVNVFAVNSFVIFRFAFFHFDTKLTERKNIRTDFSNQIQRFQYIQAKKAKK